MPNLSIIIPHHNGYRILSECIESLYQSTYQDFEIIVVDNASSDASISKIKIKYSNLHIVESSKNLGYAGGCNLGAQKSEGDFLFFLNNDTLIDKDCIENLLTRINDNEKISSVQPKIKNQKNMSLFDYAGASGGFIDYLVFPFCRGRIFNTVENDNGQYDNAEKIFWASGAGFLTKRNIFLELAGFDEDLFAHMEEIDYHWKSYLAGYEVWVEPKGILYHIGGKTLEMESPTKLYYNHRNSLMLLLSNYSLFRSLVLLDFRILLEILSSFKELFSLRPIHFLYHYKALFWIAFNIPKIKKRRKLIADIRKLNDTDLLNTIIYNKSIVFKYFLLGKKKYSDLI